MASSQRKRFLDACRGHLGVVEVPFGSNNTCCTKWYPMAGSPWCAMSMSHAAFLAGPDVAAKVGKFARTDTYAKLKASEGRLVKGSAGIEPGDILFYALHGSSFEGRFLGIHHTGAAESLRANGDLVTLEGNVSNAFKRLVRSRQGIAAYFRPDWDEEDEMDGRVVTVVCTTQDAANEVARLMRATSGSRHEFLGNVCQALVPNERVKALEAALAAVDDCERFASPRSLMGDPAKPQANGPLPFVYCATGVGPGGSCETCEREKACIAKMRAVVAEYDEGR